MDVSQIKRELQEWLDRDYDGWISNYSPKRHEGKSAVKKALKAGEEFIWSCSDEFLHNYVTLSNGTELSYLSVDVFPGIEEDSEGDLCFTSTKSWQEEDDDFIRVMLEVLVKCTMCDGAGCQECEGSGNWTFVASKWTIPSELIKQRTDQ
jgi:hypothetical protein